jgi:hypothetical protein
VMILLRAKKPQDPFLNAARHAPNGEFLRWLIPFLSQR